MSYFFHLLGLFGPLQPVRRHFPSVWGLLSVDSAAGLLRGGISSDQCHCGRPQDHPEDNIKLPIIAVNLITVHILLSAHPQDTFSRKLDRIRKSTAQDNQLTRLSHYINTSFPCEKKNLPTDLQECWNDRETLSIKFRMNLTLNSIHMITIHHLMSEHFSDSISNRSAQPEENTAQKKYFTRLLDHTNIDQLCDRESLPTDLTESWPHKELLHNIYGLINHGNQIIPVTHKKSTFFQDH